MTVKLMGRYDVINELGRGAQSVIYLARDTRMSRQVAIKKIGPGSTAQNEALLREARTASNLHHHNIIPLYDLAALEGSAYLVYAHIAGEPLSTVLKRAGALPLETAIHIAVELLSALANAHGQGVVHHDIKPSNVLMSESGQPFLMDFAISRAMTTTTTSKAAAAETGVTQYLAPETMSTEGGEVRSDLYSVGMLLYEMVTCSPEGGSGSSAPGKSAKREVDKKLEQIILRATERKPEGRYSSAAEMRQALLGYLDYLNDKASLATDADVASTLKFLLRRIRNKSDFPVVSGVIHEINRIVASETEDSNRLAQIILQDFALTNKLLKLVNTVSYSQFGGKINTVSKAVSILGFETVRNIAMSLIVMESIQNKPQADELKEVVVSSFLSGIVAVQLAEWKSAQEVEEAMICAMFFNLGRMLTKFYFFEESEEIARVMLSHGVEEEQAAREVLGISYNELGLGIARSWNFPDSLVAGMQKISGENALTQDDGHSRLSVAVNMANDLCAVASVSDPRHKEDALQRIKLRYSGVAEASEDRLSNALVSSLHDLSKRSKVLGIESAKSPLLKNISTWVAYKNAIKGAEQTQETGEQEEPVDVEALLRAGLQDVTNSMAGEYKLNDILQMVLETIYRGLGFRYVMILSRDAKRNMMAARFGFGASVADILPKFSFSLNFEADVFHLAISKGLDIVIEDVTAPNIASKIPAWYGKCVDSAYFVLLPMVINNVAFGLIYADMFEARKLQIGANEMSLLRELRNQAVIAIKQKT